MKQTVLRKIMYVEDEPDIQMIAKLALESLGGYEVVLCDSGKEALKNVETVAPDLILMDVMMPELDGIETFQQLRENPATRLIPIIFMTARIQEHEIRRYKELGVVSLIFKPFDPLTLSDQIRSIWEKWNEKK